MKHVAFLRGINVGGHTKVPMQTLRAVFESLGYRDVRTVLNSGNVVFEEAGYVTSQTVEAIEHALEAEFGFHADVILRPQSALQALVEEDPFGAIEMSPATRLYVTFRGAASPSHRLRGQSKPTQSPEAGIQILRVTDAEVCTSIVLAPQRGTVDLMKFLEKEFGRNLTTRSWNTVAKVAAL